MKRGTFRNKISKLMMMGVVELECNSGLAFYTLKGIHFGKKRQKMTQLMTSNRMGVISVTDVINETRFTNLYKDFHRKRKPCMIYT